MTVEAPLGMVVTTSVPKAGNGKTVVRRGSYNGTMYCQVSYAFKDLKGELGVQRQCGVRAAPWYFILDPGWQRTVVGGLNERGLKWWKSGHEMLMQSPDPNVIPSYIFHGTFSDTGNGDFVYYEDICTWRHNIGPGGNAELQIWGSLAFKGKG